MCKSKWSWIYLKKKRKKQMQAFFVYNLDLCSWIHCLMLIGKRCNEIVVVSRIDWSSHVIRKMSKSWATKSMIKTSIMVDNYHYSYHYPTIDVCQVNVTIYKCVFYQKTKNLKTTNNTLNQMFLPIYSSNMSLYSYKVMICSFDLLRKNPGKTLWFGK